MLNQTNLKGRSILMTSTVATVMFVVVASCSVGVARQPAASDTSKEPAAKKVDWAGLQAFLEAGEYAKATVAADAILEQVTPDRKAPDFLPRSVDRIDALMRRGFAELQLFRLDAADATFVATQAIFKDREFIKQVNGLEKHGGPKAATPLIDLDLRLIELQNLQAAVALERLRLMGGREGASGVASVPSDPSEVERVRGQIEAIRVLLQESADVRTKLAERFDLGGPTVVNSPHKKTLMSSFHPELITGIMTFHLSRLPFDLPAAPAPQPPPKSKGPAVALDLDGLSRAQLLQSSLEHFQAASKALDGSIEQVLPKGMATAPLDKRLEAEVLLLRLALARCEPRFHANDLGGAKKDVDEVMRLHESMTTARKLANTELHPELVRPLVIATEITLAESDVQTKAGMVDEARALVAKASQSLARAAAIPLPEDHRQRHELTRLAAAIENRRAGFKSSVVTMDAADVAAQRIRRAVEGTKPGS
jgi:hypothetical protein